MTEFKPETLLLHGGQQPDPVTGAIAVPIYRTTAYAFKDTAHARNSFRITRTRKYLFSYYEPNSRCV